MEKIITLKIEKENESLKIESVLRNSLRFSSALLGKLKRKDGSVLLNGANAKLTDRVKSGDELIVKIPKEKTENIIPVKMPLDILYEDEDILAVNKPSSMPVHPVRNHEKDTLANGILCHLGEKSTIHIITRLDRETSGIVLVAKNPLSAAILTEQIKNRKIEKEYIAIVEGTPNPEKGTITAHIKKEGMGICREVSPDGKEAITEYETIKISGNLVKIRAIPITGRTHQIRVHMSYIGTPIYGDSLYGKPRAGERTKLHCEKISFTHPITNKPIVVKAPLPADMTELIN